MMITRIAGRMAKPVWSSVVSRHSCPKQILTAACRRITTGKDCIKLGNVGGRMKHHPTDDDLHSFIGTWLEVRSKHFKNFLKEAGVNPQKIAFLRSHKMWVSYEINGECWSYSYGMKDTDYSRNLSFKLGQSVEDAFFDGSSTKITFNQEGPFLIEKQEPMEPGKSTINIQKEIKDMNKMTATFKVKDVVAKKWFRRLATQEEKSTAWASYGF